MVTTRIPIVVRVSDCYLGTIPGVEQGFSPHAKLYKQPAVPNVSAAFVNNGPMVDPQLRTQTFYYTGKFTQT